MTKIKKLQKEGKKFGFSLISFSFILLFIGVVSGIILAVFGFSSFWIVAGFVSLATSFSLGIVNGLPGTR